MSKEVLEVLARTRMLSLPELDLSVAKLLAAGKQLQGPSELLMHLIKTCMLRVDQVGLRVDQVGFGRGAAAHAHSHALPCGDHSCISMRPYPCMHSHAAIPMHALPYRDSHAWDDLLFEEC